MKKGSLFSIIILLCLAAGAQQQPGAKAALPLERHIDSINRLIDGAVVGRKLQILRQLYAEDFVFTHGTGTVDTKSSWLKHLEDTSVHFISRVHDSVTVEVHANLAIASGTLRVQRSDGPRISRYALRYVRVYQKRKKAWQLVSHRTTAEWHLEP